MPLSSYSESSTRTALRDVTDLQQPRVKNHMLLEQGSPGKIVVLNGFPGTGKLTILQYLKKLLPADTTCLLDNHLLIDPVVADIPDRSDRHHELRRLVRAPIFEELGSRAKKDHTILMTVCLAAESQRDATFFQEHLDISRKSHVPIYWINLRCDIDILEQRLSAPERQQSNKSKLTDVHIVRDLVKFHRLIEPIATECDGAMLTFEEMDANGSVESSARRLMGIV
ncbi:chloramphenicol phosphotransferase-like protein [Fusarium austroafricanum]|uniref:Chloramphenicol phosphotransferase-like protein n=1 Tax=Fusarium austroafricanum TaxID=2364996 RepID=A0A8H4KQ88_9HYPO|nr:chloramphenicol phosphotransferase-like protein [Fusarium austroafricanum]